jgi:hypothetical protein
MGQEFEEFEEFKEEPGARSQEPGGVGAYSSFVLALIGRQ